MESKIIELIKYKIKIHKALEPLLDDGDLGKKICKVMIFELENLLDDIRQLDEFKKIL